jgi:hypothetical protein
MQNKLKPAVEPQMQNKLKPAVEPQMQNKLKPAVETQINKTLSNINNKDPKLEKKSINEINTDNKFKITSNMINNVNELYISIRTPVGMARLSGRQTEFHVRV